MEQNKFYQIKNVTEHEYTLVGCDGNVIICPIQEVDKTASVFTIEDAKEGDVLYSHDNNILWIYKNPTTSYVTMLLNYIKYGGIVINCDIVIPLDSHPATKEQRDLLFSTMKEAGYEWDAEKTERRIRV